MLEIHPRNRIFVKETSLKDVKLQHGGREKIFLAFDLLVIIHKSLELSL
jgi:hypothetical protein